MVAVIIGCVDSTAAGMAVILAGAAVVVVFVVVGVAVEAVVTEVVNLSAVAALPKTYVGGAHAIKLSPDSSCSVHLARCQAAQQA